MFGEGISKVGEIIDVGVDYNIIGKSGSWFNYNGTKLAQGRDAVKALLKDNPELMEELETQIREALKAESNSDTPKKTSKSKASEEEEEITED